KARLSVNFAADYADIFEIRGMPRQTRGTDLDAEVTQQRVALGYRGLDEVVRRTSLHFDPMPSQLSASSAHAELLLQPQEEAFYAISAACERGADIPNVLTFNDARIDSQAEAERYNT